MPNPCREALHFFIAIYLIILVLSCIYLSFGFPCDPYADLRWDSKQGKPTDFTTPPNLPFGRKRGCWADCEAYALRLHFLRNPHLNDNPTLALFHALLTNTHPNPFCFFPWPTQDPFCAPPPLPLNVSAEEGQGAKDAFLRAKATTRHIHTLALTAISLDFAVVCLIAILIYLAIHPQTYPYAVTFAVAMATHLASLFLSSHLTKWLSCTQDGERFCDGSQDIRISSFRNNAFRILLPEKPYGISNYEISIVMKNLNMVGLSILGLCYFSMQRVYDDVQRGRGPPAHHAHANRGALAPREAWEEEGPPIEDGLAPGD